MTRAWISMMVAVVATVGAVAEGAELKLAVVDMRRVIEAHPDTGQAEALLAKQKEEFQLERQEMLKQLERLNEEFEATVGEARNKALSESARDEKLEIAEAKGRELKLYQRQIRETAAARTQQLTDQNNRMMRRIVEKVRGIIKEHATQQGYTLVLDSSGVGLHGVETIVYTMDSLDITATVLKLTEAADPAPEEEAP